MSLKFSNKKQEKFQLNSRCNHQRGLGVVAQNQSSSSSTRLPVVFEDEVAEEEEKDDSEVHFRLHPYLYLIRTTMTARTRTTSTVCM